MDLKQKMVDMAIEATGDGEIFVAGDFEPKGMLWKRSAGAAAGSLVGGAVSGGDSWAKAAGAAGGMAVGTLAAGKGKAPVVVLAATPTKLYVLATSMGQGMLLAKHLEVLNTMNRDDLTVTIKKRAMTRTVVIEDESDGGKIELEGLKLGLHHMNDLLNVLDEQETVEAETRARLEAGEADGAPA
ncbi:hypothetical protein ACFLQ7_00090 [Actinomycetota bacterium]